MDSLLQPDILFKFLPSLATTLCVIAILWLMNRLLIVNAKSVGSERLVPRQIAMLVLTLAGIISIIISLPIEESLRNQVIGLIGILLSGLIAFSSTNIIANLMAGLLLRITKPFSIGDFVRVGEYFGRVSERGLFDTEIQSEARELIALPNSFVANNPVTTVHPTGAIVSAKLSIGYDVHHQKLEPLLKQAAEKSGLSDAFVHIIELGDFSVVYRVSGFLSEVKGLITARSNLMRAVLDTLHEAGVEIMSPSFMNQRPQPPGSTTIPNRHWARKETDTVEAEDIVFDKAEKAQQRDTEKKEIYQRISELEEQAKSEEKVDKAATKEEIAELQEQLKLLKSKDADKEESGEEEEVEEAADEPAAEDKSSQSGNGKDEKDKK